MFVDLTGEVFTNAAGDIFAPTGLCSLSELLRNAGYEKRELDEDLEIGEDNEEERKQ